MASRRWLDKQLSYRNMMRLVGVLFLVEFGGIDFYNAYVYNDKY